MFWKKIVSPDMIVLIIVILIAFCLTVIMNLLMFGGF